ncbi:leucine-rich repeat domain-containing protein [Clostridium perfringens]|uniref:leucine-rich repeat domain-containing protein n=1 Tax=Clostridium perfringens TaxID=1502 RepID=UPI0039E94D8D
MKKNKIENLLHSKGYVSIETLIVVGLIIATGAFLTSKLVWKGKDVANSNNKNMTIAGKTMDDNSFNNSTPADSSSQVQEVKHSVENPSDLSDFDYAIIDDNYINDELKKIDEEINNRPSDIPAPPPEVNDMKALILKLKEFKGGIIITGYHGNKTDIEIPSYIDGKEVTVIASMAFAPKIPESSEDDMGEPPEGKLKSVKLPNTLKYIGEDAFAFNQLTEITIPDSVTEIGRGAFERNTLKSIKLSSNLIKIEPCVFFHNKLKSVIIPDSVVEVGVSAFNNNNLTSIKLSGNLIKIEPCAFSDNKLELVTIPDSVTEIGFSAFSRNNLTSIKLSDNLIKIEPCAFSYNKLKSVIIPDSVVEVGGSAFQNNNLTSIKWGRNLNKIGRNAFSGNKLESVTIPDSVTEIDELAFSRNNLTSIKLGSNLKRIGDFAFSGNKLESVIVPNSVTYLGCDVFKDNPLKSKVIPKTCK